MAKKKHFRSISLSRVPNLYIRYLLGQISKELGGFTSKDWDDANRFFGNSCAYTGLEDPDNQFLQMDHVVPHNREHGGLHIRGNVVPCCPEANEAKLSQTLDEFFASSAPCLQHLTQEEREARKQRILEFQRLNGYDKIAEKISHDILKQLQSEYEKVRELAQTSARDIVKELREVQA